MAGRRSLSLALEEGFLNDNVRIRSNGREIARLDNLSTRVQIGLARTIDVELSGDENIVVELPDKNLRIEIPGDIGSFVGVSVTADGLALSLRSSDVPAGYA